MQAINDLINLFSTIKLLRIKFVFFISAMIMALASAAAEGLCIILLMGIFRATIGMDINSLQYSQIGLWSKHLGLGVIKPEYHLILLGVLFCCLNFIKNICHYISMLFLSYTERQFTHKLRIKIFETCLGYGKVFFDRNSTGAIHQISVTIPQTIGHYLSQLNVLASQCFLIIIYISTLIKISPWMSMWSFILLPLLVYGLQWLIEKIRKSSEYYADSQKELGKSIFNTFSCIQLVKSYNYEAEEVEKLRRVSDHARTCEYSIDKKINLIPSLQDTLTTITIMSIFVGASFIYLRQSRMTEIAGLVVFFYALKKSATSLSWINESKASLAMISESLKKIFDLIAPKQKYLIMDGALELLVSRNDIEFSEVYLEYSQDRKALNGLSLFCEHGRSTAIVGQSGAGKTSLVNLLLRFYVPDSGVIKIGGVDISRVSGKSLRSKIALVGQDVQLFNDSLRVNLAYGLTNASEEEIWQALARAELAPFVHRLPKGLETPIGDHGVQLSGGERQRLSIARAFLKNAEILILDEATSSLDTETEQAIQKTLHQLTFGKTTVIIAHRLSTIQNTDKIIIIENGRFSEQGNFEELLKLKGKFYQFWNKQHA